MNNLHRELAPISEAAWKQIEEEASRTLKRHLAARRVVDVVGPKGLALSAVGTGHVRQIAPPSDDIQSAQREVKALIELRVPFQLSRQQIDDVERGATDSDWSPVKDARSPIIPPSRAPVTNASAITTSFAVSSSASSRLASRPISSAAPASQSTPA